MVKSGDIKVSASQLGILALALEDLLGIQSKAKEAERKAHQNDERTLANLPKSEPINAREDAGKALGIADGTVKAAHAVQEAEKRRAWVAGW